MTEQAIKHKKEISSFLGKNQLKVLSDFINYKNALILFLQQGPQLKNKSII